MEAESSRFRARAIECRSLAEGARDDPARAALTDIADELDAEAATIEAEDRAIAAGPTTPIAH